MFLNWGGFWIMPHTWESGGSHYEKKQDFFFNAHINKPNTSIPSLSVFLCVWKTYKWVFSVLRALKDSLGGVPWQRSLEYPYSEWDLQMHLLRFTKTQLKPVLWISFCGKKCIIYCWFLYLFTFMFINVYLFSFREWIKGQICMEEGNMYLDKPSKQPVCLYSSN